MPDSPSILNYYSGTGNVYFQKAGEVTWRHVGNAPSFKIKPTLTKKEHNSSMDGARGVDVTFITGRKLEVTIELEEFTPENLALAFLGTQSTNSDTHELIDIFTQNSIVGSLKFTGNNEQGSQYEVILASVEFQPDAEVEFIGQDTGTLTLSGIATKVAGSFGTIEELADQATA